MVGLSGPEPQRTILEEKLLSQLSDVTEPTLLIRGLPGTTRLPSPPSHNLTIVNHLTGREMQQALAETEFFLGRCGYSTLMDLQTVSCKCIFIPTPGQTEQEYLGKEIAGSGKAVVIRQKDFDLKKALHEASSFPAFSDGAYQNNHLTAIISNWLATLR